MPVPAVVEAEKVVDRKLGLGAQDRVGLEEEDAAGEASEGLAGGGRWVAEAVWRVYLLLGWCELLPPIRRRQEGRERLARENVVAVIGQKPEVELARVDVGLDVARAADRSGRLLGRPQLERPRRGHLDQEVEQDGDQDRQVALLDYDRQLCRVESGVAQEEVLLVCVEAGPGEFGFGCEVG